MLVLVVVVTAAAVFIVIVMVMLVLVVVVTAAAVFIVIVVVMLVLVVVMVMFLFQSLQFRLQAVGGLHSLQQLLAGQFVPGSGHQGSFRVMLPQKSHCHIQLSRSNGIGTGKDNSSGGLHLIVIELAKVLHVNLDLTGVNNSHGIAQLHICRGHLFHSSHHIGQLAYTGRLDHNTIRRIICDDLGQSFAKVANQAAANAAGVHFGDVYAGVLQKAAVNTDLTKFIFNQHQFLAGISLLDHLFDQRGLACAKETGINVDNSHTASSCKFSNCHYTTGADKKSIKIFPQSFDKILLNPPVSRDYSISRRAFSPTATTPTTAVPDLPRDGGSIQGMGIKSIWSGIGSWVR